MKTKKINLELQLESIKADKQGRFYHRMFIVCLLALGVVMAYIWTSI